MLGSNDAGITALVSPATPVLPATAVPVQVEVKNFGSANLNSVTTLQGQTVKISKQDGVKINDAKVITTGVEATNGIIHVIDTVLMPATAARA